MGPELCSGNLDIGGLPGHFSHNTGQMTFPPEHNQRASLCPTRSKSPKPTWALPRTFQSQQQSILNTLPPSIANQVLLPLPRPASPGEPFLKEPSLSPVVKPHHQLSTTPTHSLKRSLAGHALISVDELGSGDLRL